MDDSVHGFAVVTCCHVRSKRVSDEGSGSATQVSKESKRVGARGYVKPTRTELCLYHTDCTPCFPLWQSPSCGLNGLHVGYTTVRYLQQHFFFVSLLISIRNLICTIARDFLSFAPDLPFSTSRLRSGTNGFREPEESFYSPKRSYRLWDPLILYFNDEPGSFQR
jgi:hypothetical protein